MSSSKRDELRERMTAAASGRLDAENAPGKKTAIRTAPARVTLNLPPSLYRDIERWALDAAETLVIPRVSVQDALRAMIRACLTDNEASSAALASVREGAELSDSEEQEDQHQRQ